MGIDVPMNSSMNSLSARLSANGARSATDFDFRHATREARRHAGTRFPMMCTTCHAHLLRLSAPLVGRVEPLTNLLQLWLFFWCCLCIHISGHARCGKLSAGNGIDYRRYWIRLSEAPFIPFFPFSRPVQATSSWHFICLRAALPFACVAFQIRWHLMT